MKQVKVNISYFNILVEHESYHRKTVTVIYGLEHADLIMLCINHLPISKQIYLI